MSEREFDEFLRGLSEHLGRDVAREHVTGELRDHLDEHFAELSAAGVPRDEAVRLALAEFGDAVTLANGLATASRRPARRRIVRWSGATVVSLAASMIVLWAMWPQDARVPLAPEVAAQAARDESEDELPKLSDQEVQIEAALRKTISVDLVETPLADVVHYLVESTGIAIEIDARGLESAGIAVDVPMTLKAVDVRLETVLDRLTQQRELTWTYRDEALEITTSETENTHLQSRVYPVADLLIKEGAAGGEDLAARGEHLASVLRSSFGEWEETGGMGTAVVNEGTLIVSQSWRIHREIRQYLHHLRQASIVNEMQAPALVSLPAPQDHELRIARALQARGDVDFVETPLADVAQFLSDKFKVPVVLDQRALEAAAIGPDTPITLRGKNISLQSILNRASRSKVMAWTVAQAAIVLSIPEEVDAKFRTTRLYPVQDLLRGLEGAERDQAAAQLVQLVMTNVNPSNWGPVGGVGVAGAIVPQGVLVVTHVGETHRDVERFLSDLRAGRGKATALPARRPTDKVIQVYRLHLPRDPSGEAADLDALEEMIRTLVEPDSWRNLPDAYVRHIGDRLVVRQTRACHTKILKFLNEQLDSKATVVQPGKGGGNLTGEGGGMGGGGVQFGGGAGEFF